MGNKVCYVGAPAIFALELACQTVNDALRTEKSIGCCYLVGSSMERPDWRDVDVRYIMSDQEFSDMFPGVDLSTDSAIWELNPRWLLFNTSICEWMRRQTGLPIDFQIQPQTFANERHDKMRSAIGLRLSRREPRPLTEDETNAVNDFQTAMETETIPAIVETIEKRQAAANGDRGVLDEAR